MLVYLENFYNHALTLINLTTVSDMFGYNFSLHSKTLRYIYIYIYKYIPIFKYNSLSILSVTTSCHAILCYELVHIITL